jgi:hypothetical protein
LVKDRLQNAIAELKVNADENRFQELIYYLEKRDHRRKVLDKSPVLLLETINGTEANVEN